MHLWGKLSILEKVYYLMGKSEIGWILLVDEDRVSSNGVK